MRGSLVIVGFPYADRSRASLVVAAGVVSADVNRFDKKFHRYGSCPFAILGGDKKEFVEAIARRYVVSSGHVSFSRKSFRSGKVLEHLGIFVHDLPVVFLFAPRPFLESALEAVAEFRENRLPVRIGRIRPTVQGLVEVDGITEIQPSFRGHDEEFKRYVRSILIDFPVKLWYDEHACGAIGFEDGAVIFVNSPESRHEKPAPFQFSWHASGTDELGEKFGIPLFEGQFEESVAFGFHLRTFV